nr:hypothetical protein [Tanacetum cinerariifolium]
TLRPADILVFGWAGGKHACVDLTGVSTLIWSEISMGFIVGLSNSGGKTVIMVVVDRLSKDSHFMALSHPFTAIQVAQLFLDNVYKLHGLPKVIISGRDEVDSVDRSLAAREAIIQMLQFHLSRAQVRMKAVADTYRTERIFDVGQWILTELGMAAYKLQLPPTAQIHPVFHVSQLKLFKGDPLAVQEVLPKCDPNGHLACVPIKVLERRMIKEHNKLFVYVLIHWSYGSQADATWELATNLEKRFLDFSFDS